MADGISIDITETVTKVDVTENVTTVAISPQVTTLELRGISISNAGSSTAMAYNGSSNTLGQGATVSDALDHINANGFNLATNNTLLGNTTVSSTHAINFETTTPLYTALNLANNNIIGVNKLSFSDAGPDEGLQWDNIKIFESPNDLTTDTAGNLQIAYKQPDGSYTRQLTVAKDKTEVLGDLNIYKGIVETMSKSNSITLEKGDIVYISGNANGIPLVDKAVSSDSSKMPAYGIVASVEGNSVEVISSGILRNVKSSSLSPSQKLYVSSTSSGSFATSAPSEESNLIQKIGTVVNNLSATSGIISTPTALSNTQHVYVSNVTRSGDGNEVAITLSYTCSDTTTTGIGFSLNFDPSILTSPVTSNVYSTSLASSPVLNDAGNGLIFSWGDVAGTWPGSATIDLATITFTLSNTTVGDDTNLTFSNTNSAAGFSVVAQSQTINAILKGYTGNFVDIKLNTLGQDNTTPNLDTGNIFLGVNNVATPTSFDTTFGNSFATRSVGNLSDVDITTAAPTNNQVLVWSTDKFVPADQAGAQTINFADLGTTPTTIAGYGITDAFDGQYSSLSGKPTLYSDAAVDTHLNQSTAANNEVLSWNGSDYDWVARIALTDISVSETEGTPSGDGGIAYNNTTGVFTYTPPDLSSYLTTVAFTDITSKPTTISGYGITDALEIGTSSTTAMAGNTALSAIGGSLDLSSQVTGTLPVGNMAATALTTVQTVANEAAQLALTTQEGDVVVRTDENKTYMRNSGTADPHDMTNFTLLATPTDAVTSVDGNTGVVTTLQIGTTAGTALEGNTTLADLGGQAALTFGIANTNAVKIDAADVADDEYARFTGSGLESRSTSEVKTDLSLNNVENTAISTFAGSANITTVGTVTSGTWQGTAIADAYISSAGTWNGKQDALTFGIADDNAVEIDDTDAASGNYARFTANGIEGRATSDVLSDIGAQASLTFGIADDNAVEIDDTDVTSTDYARFTANGLEGRSASEVKTDLSLNNVENTAISTFAGSANITTVGTVTSGTWQGTAIADAYISSAGTWNGKQDALTFGIANTNAVKIDAADVADDEYARFTGSGLESRSTSEVLSDIGGQAALTFGIADDNAVEIDDTDVTSGDYAKFTANGLEGRSASEVKTDLSLNNVENTAISTFAGSANITTVGTVTSGTWQGTAIADAYISSAGTWNGKQDALTFGIANTNAVKIDAADVADDEYARFTASGLESRSTSEVLSDIGAQAVLTEGAFVDGDKTKLDAVDNDTPAFDSVSIDTGASTWEISESGNKLIFKYGGTSKMTLDSSGNLKVTGNITAFGTI